MNLHSYLQYYILVVTVLAQLLSSERLFPKLLLHVPLANTVHLHQCQIQKQPPEYILYFIF